MVDDISSAGPFPRWSNADGLDGPLVATGSDESDQAAGTTIGQFFGGFNYAGLTVPFGSLVGSIGGSNFFYVGTNFACNAIASGELLLWFWDANSGDNADSIQVTITGGNNGQGNGDDGQGNGDNGENDHIVVPEPSALAFLVLGLIGTGLVRRRYG